MAYQRGTSEASAYSACAKPLILCFQTRRWRNFCNSASESTAALQARQYRSQGSPRARAIAPTRRQRARPARSRRPRRNRRVARSTPLALVGRARLSKGVARPYRDWAPRPSRVPVPGRAGVCIACDRPPHRHDVDRPDLCVFRPGCHPVGQTAMEKPTNPPKLAKGERLTERWPGDSRLGER